MANAITIGRLAGMTGVNIETIRYYERSGLLPEPVRAANGYRHYGNSAAARLRFIRRARELGFGVDEIRTLLQLADHPEQPCDTADTLAREHLDAVESKIRDLQAIRDELARLADCPADEAGHCRLLEALEARQCCFPDDR